MVDNLAVVNDQGYTSTPEMRYFERAMECQSKINQIAKKIYAPNSSVPIRLWINPDILSLPETVRQSISLPYLFLIKTSDIPEEFRISGLSDPRLQSDDFIQKVADWTYKFFGKQVKKPLTLLEKETLKIFLLYIQDPEQSENAKEFVLAHEIGHLFHQHGEGAPELFSLATLFKATSLILLVSLATLLCPVQFLWAVLGISAALTAGFVMLLIREMHRSRSFEKEADLVAAKFSERARRGGIYLFETFIKGQKQSRDRHMGLRFLFSADGNNRALYFTHPSETERIGYLKA
jgi:peptidase M48-like protein